MSSTCGKPCSAAFPCLLIVVAGLACYARTLAGGFIFDDIRVILLEPALKAADIESFLPYLALRERPVRLLSFFIDSRLWGLDPFGYRLTNLLLHLVNGCLVYAAACRLTMSRSTAFIAAALFTLHPALPAAVAYPSARKDVLGTTLAIATLLSYVHFRTLRPSRLYGLLTFLLLAAAVMTKEMFVSLVPVILVADMLLFRRKISPALLSGAAVIAAAAVFFIARHRQIGIASPGEFAMIPVYACSYLLLFAFPPATRIDYAAFFDGLPAVIMPLAWASVVVIAATVWRRRHERLTAFLCCSAALSLLPVLQIIPHTEKFADHYLYFPAFFLSLLAASSLSAAVPRPVSAGFILAFALLTWSHAVTYTDQISFWKAALDRNDRNFRALYALGMHALAGQRYDEAGVLFERGSAIARERRDHDQVAYAYQYDFVVAEALRKINLGRMDEAVDALQGALAAIPESPKREEIAFHLGYARILHEGTAALPSIYEMLARNPGYDRIKYLLYDSFWASGDRKGMDEFISNLLARDRNDQFALVKRCIGYYRAGRTAEAESARAAIAHLYPRNFYELNDFAEIELARSNFPLARIYLELALQENPTYGRTRRNLRFAGAAD